MKNFNRTIVPILAAILLLTTCGNGDSGIKIDETAQSYFNDSYETCRNAFRSTAADVEKKYRKVEIGKLKIPSKIDNDLTIDYCYIPAVKKKSRLFIVDSGIHGIEGFAGSAIQLMFMKEILPALDRNELGILIIHGINPYGFKYLRKATENNVDLNRNFGTDDKIFAKENDGFTMIYDLLTPKGKVDTGTVGNRFFPAKAVYNIIKYSMGALRQAALQGQYQYPEGFYYGGKTFEPQKMLLEPLFKKLIRTYGALLEINLHTGYGARHKLHFFPNPIKDRARKKNVEDIYKGFHIDWGDSGDFYITYGDFCDYICKLVPGSKACSSMVWEYGTMDSQTTMGSIRSIHSMILENQGAHHGYKTEEDEKEVKQGFLDMYYPSSKAWRSEVIRQARKAIPAVLKNYEAI